MTNNTRGHLLKYKTCQSSRHKLNTIYLPLQIQENKTKKENETEKKLEKNDDTS